MRQVCDTEGISEYLTRKFLPALSSSWLETALLPVTAGKGVSNMRTYEVRVLVPKLELIDAEDEADLFEKVGELYKKLYRQEVRELVEILPEPEDFA